MTRSASAWFGEPRDVLASLPITDLSEEEARRAEGFRVAEDRDAYVAAHLMLRHALASRAGIPAADWEFVTNERGRPMVAGVPAPSISLSHTRGAVACAVGDAGAIGVDVQGVDPRVLELEPVALSPSEREEVERLSGAERCRRVTAIWALKESYTKATGLGLPGIESSGGLVNLSFDFTDQGITLRNGSGSSSPSGGWAFAARFEEEQVVALAAFDASDGPPFVTIGHAEVLLVRSEG